VGALALGAGQDLASHFAVWLFQLILLSETGRFAGPFPNGHDGLLKRVNGDGLRGLALGIGLIVWQKILDRKERGDDAT